MKLIIGLIAALFLIPDSSYGQDGKSESKLKMEKELKDLIQNEMSEHNIIGLSAAVIYKNRTVLAEGFGTADKEAKLPAKASTLFPIASVTKTFTGIAVMQLAENGLIDLDRPIAEYIPELSLPGGEEKKISTRMLLTHHSGIQGDIMYHWLLPQVKNEPLVYEEIIGLINKVGTIFPPGKMHAYSNAGYALLGVLIQRVSGMSYPEYIRRKIFNPLSMENSIVFAGEPTKSFVAKGYFKKETCSMPMKLGIPAGGIACSAKDAAKYLQAVIKSYREGEPLLKRESIRKMMRPHNKNNKYDEGFPMGLSWFLQSPQSKYTKYAAHRGELPPYHAMMIVLPEEEIAVLIAHNTNRAGSAAELIADKIVNYLYEKKTGIKIQIKEKQPQKIQLDKSYLKQFEGLYPNVYFGPMRLKLKGKKLKLKSPVMPTPLILSPRADTSFSLKASILGLPFSVKQLEAMSVEFRKIGEEEYMYFNINDKMLNPNLKITAPKIPKNYEKYAGKYRVINMENSDRVVKDIEIKLIKKDKLALFKYTFLKQHQFNMLLEPIDGENAKFAGVGYFLGDKIRWEHDKGKIYMYWSGLKLIKKP